MVSSRIVVALDYPTAHEMWGLVDRIEPGACRVKVGKELFTRAGPQVVEQLAERGFDVFLDLKFHDIPNTVERACAAAADLGVWMVNVHALGGRRMIEAARQGVEGRARRPLLIAVTVLTSMAEADLHEVGLQGSPADNVLRLADVAVRAGADGVVCSPQEVAGLRARHGAEFCLVTPGIRPAGVATGDQRRIMTPLDAVRAGSDYLVIGRPITAAADPMTALAAIEAELATAQ